MGKSITAAAIALIFAAVAGSAHATPAPERPANHAARAANPAFERKVVKIVNAKRTAHGCGKLKISKAVHRAARRHTNKMAAAGVLSHKLRGEPALGARLNNAGYHGATRIGENVAFGYQTPRAVVQGWFDDIPHRRVMLDCHYKDTGVGYAETAGGIPYWTQDFGRK